MENSTQIQFIQTFGQDGPIGIIDVDTAVQFPINFAVGDIKDPFAKKGVKSYKFSIVGSKETNQLLNHYYDINIVDGTYNNNLKQKVAILRNGVIILDNAYMQLLSIKKQTHDVYSDQQIIYDIEVGDDVTSFFTKITNKYLEDLDFQDMNHVYSAEDVIDSFPNSAIRDNVLLTGGYKYVLPYTTLNKYRLEECRPAISVYEYWNRIHQAAGYQWEWNGFDSDQIRMDKLWIPYNGDKPKMNDQLLFQVAAERVTPFTTNGSPFPGYMTDLGAFFIANVEVLDLLNAYNPVTGIYTAPFYSGTSSLNATFKVNYSFNLVNPSAGTAYLSESGGLPLTDKFWTWRSGAALLNITTSTSSIGAVFSLDTIKSTSTSAFSVAPGTTVLSTGTITTGTIPVNSISLNDQFQTSVFSAIQANDTTIRFKSSIVGGTNIAVRPQLVITSIEMILIPNIDTYGFGNIVDLNNFVPQKIKQSDFIKAISNMYNLVISPDEINDRKIIYSARDVYYDDGTEKNWTDKIATDKGSDISFISNTSTKNIVLTYKPDKDSTNVEYTSETKEIYGQLEYIIGNENIKGLETKEIVFSPTPIARTPFGTYNPIWIGQTPKCNIRVLLDGGVQSTVAPYSIVDYDIGAVEYGETGIVTYPMLTHLDNPDTPLFDINFGLCDKYFFDFTSVTNNNLYSMFWRRTIGQIDKGKLFTAYFYLNEYDISILKLNDKIFVKDTWYNINSLQYDPNSFGPTKVVLMTIDDELAIDIIKPRPGLSTGSLSESVILSDVSVGVYDSINWNRADGSVRVMGTGNLIGPDIKNVLVVGNNRIVEDSNTVYTENFVAENIILNGKDLQELFKSVDTVQTTNATATTLTVFDILDDTMIYLSGTVNGYADDFSAGAGAFYLAVFRKTGGVITQIGTSTINLKEDFANPPVVAVNTDGTSIFVIVTGLLATTINWTNTYEYSIG
jgi:hypothetical protein